MKKKFKCISCGSTLEYPENFEGKIICGCGRKEKHLIEID